MGIRRAAAAAALTVAVAVGMTAVGDVAEAAQARPTVLAGQFCKGSDVGKVVTASNGATVICKNVNGYNRWVVK
jgi:hypothetical protein